MKAGAPESVDAYLAGVAPDARAALETLREQIRAAAPAATEGINYGVPAFKQKGPLVSFGAAAKHCAFYVQSPAVMEAFRDELASYDTAKGTVRFTPGKPLPAALIAKLVKARIAENEAAKAPPAAQGKER